MSVIGNRLNAWLAWERLSYLLALVAMALALPSIGNGLQADDFFHREILLMQSPWRADDASITGMFTFVDGDPDHVRKGINAGGLPWWTYQELRISFFRPLSELTHVLDYRLWPDSPRLMHLHNLMWFGAMVFLAGMLYRSTMEPMWVAGLAALLFAIDDAHGVPAGWLANRNAVVAAVFGILSLILHIRWRRDAWKPGALLGPLFFLVALLSSEAAVATGAYVFAYEVTLGRGGLRAKALAILPFAVVGAGWWITYGALGFGTWGSGAYINPGGQPWLFARAVLERAPVLLCGQWLQPPADLYSYLPREGAVVVLLVCSVIALLISIGLIPLLRRDAIARFWGLGMVLALLPVCATFPTNRLLVFTGIGGMGLVAQFLAAWFNRAGRPRPARGWRILTGTLAILFILNHLILAPLRLPATCMELARITRHYLEAPMIELSEQDGLSGKTVFFLNAPSAIMLILVPYINTDLGALLPHRTHVLSSGLHEYMDIERVGENALEIQPRGGFASAEIDKLFRNSSHPMQVGDRIHVDPMTVEVVSLTADQRPLRARFEFSKPLEDPGFLFIQHHLEGAAPFALPGIGEAVRLTWATRLDW